MGIMDHLRHTIVLEDDRARITAKAQRYLAEHGITDIVDPVTEAVWQPEEWLHTVAFWQQIYQHCQERLNPTVSSWILLHLLRHSRSPASRTDY